MRPLSRERGRFPDQDKTPGQRTTVTEREYLQNGRFHG